MSIFPVSRKDLKEVEVVNPPFMCRFYRSSTSPYLVAHEITTNGLNGGTLSNFYI